MNEVADGIFVGAESDASDESLLNRHSIDIVISLTHSQPDTGDITRIDVPMRDGPQNSEETFSNAVDKVMQQYQNDQSILIHCSAGSSRSPSVAATAITSLTGNTLTEAFNQVIERRPDTDPHDALVRQAVKIIKA